MSNAKLEILTQRKIEMNLLQPIIEALSETFESEQIRSTITHVIESIAYTQGKNLKQTSAHNDLNTYSKHWEQLAAGNALELADMKLTKDELSFKVTRCEYAEYYKKINAQQHGEILSCCRDEAFLKGYSERINMHRSTCIMHGEDACTFTFVEK